MAARRVGVATAVVIGGPRPVGPAASTSPSTPKRSAGAPPAMLDVFREPIGGAAAQNNPVLRFIDWVLRGIGQVVFQSNWLTGAVILGAIFYNSRVFGVACLLGVVVSTLTALALGADQGLIDAGLFGFNGALLAIGINAYMSKDFTHGQWPGWRLYVFIIVGAAFTSVIFSAIAALLGSHKVPVLTAAFVFTGWLFLFAVLHFANLHPGPLLSAALPKATAAGSHYTWATWYQGSGKGIAEIFLQDNWIAGFIILAGIAINTRIGAAMCFLASVVAIGVAVVLGAPEVQIHLGLFGFNACLTAIAIGGFFFVMTPRLFLYTLGGIMVTTWVWASIATVLSPIGMPTFTSAFVVVAWFMLIAKDGFPGLVPVPPAEATYPEDNLRRYLKSRQSVGAAAAANGAPAAANTCGVHDHNSACSGGLGYGSGASVLVEAVLDRGVCPL